MKKGMIVGEKLKRIVDIFFNVQFLIFVSIGCINTISTTVFSLIYTRILSSISAFVLGYLTGILISYTLNTVFTFRDKFNIVSLFKFTVSTIPNFIIQFIIVYIGVSLLDLPNIVCYVISALIGVPVTFFIMKFYVFVKKR
ncbi:MAG: GtrA family protein [Cellulosilyticum sp.]|nr:GtrA family protein [Cellulosilyticum sp.]